MKAAAYDGRRTFSLPPRRVLSSWRSDLATYNPRRLWLAHLLLHRVECLVRVARRQEIDPFRAALLRQLSAGAPPERLRLDREVLAHWSHEFAADGLLEADGGGWRPTDKGRRALDAGAYTTQTEERRVFTFLDEGGPEQPPLFLPLHGPAVLLEPPPGWRIDAAAAEECVRRPDEWKARHGFPADVEAVLGPAGAGAADWRRVMLDRPEQILLVFMPSGDAARPAWLGFAVLAEGWALQAKAPALVLPVEEGRAAALPELGAEPPPESWRAAWRSWCRQRGVCDADADACGVQLLEERVRVEAPRRLVERLAGDSDEAWLLTGEDRTRVAAPMEILEVQNQPGAPA